METAINFEIALGISFILGTFVGCVILRTIKGNAKTVLKLEAELKAAQAKINEQKQQLEKHFMTSAELLSTLATDYKKLYEHLAQTSDELLPEANKKIAFFNQEELSKLGNSQKGQPKDYSEGSSGLFKQN